MSNLKKKVIKIVEASPKMLDSGSIMTKIKDENNLSYTFFQKKLDGSETKAYQTFKMLPDGGLGQTVEVSFDEQEWSDGVKGGIRRNIAWISPVARWLSASPSSKQLSAAPVASTGSLSDEVIRMSLAQWALISGINPEDPILDKWIEYVKNWKVKKNLPLQTLMSDFNATDVTDWEEQISVENIPF